MTEPDREFVVAVGSALQDTLPSQGGSEALLEEFRRKSAFLAAQIWRSGIRQGLAWHMHHYFALRGSRIPRITTGEKAIEEAHELVEAIASGDRTAILREVADLALVVAVVAAQYGTTVEEAITAKGAYDAGRGEPKPDPRVPVVVR
jgi:hypothetical protein